MAYITTDDVYRIAGIDNTVVSTGDVTALISYAEDYVENMLGTKFYDSGNSEEYAEQVTETYDGDDSDTLFLDHYPLVTIQSLSISGTSVSTGQLWKWDLFGKIRLKSTAEVTTFQGSNPQLVSITYRYGEDVASNEKVKHYTAVVCAMMVLVNQIGGTFDDVTSFELPEISGSLGEPYTNIREALNQLKEQERLLRQYIRVKPQFG